MHVRIIGRGTYYILLQRLCNRLVTNWKQPDILVNWGLAGQRWQQRMALMDFHKDMPIINYPVNLTKFTQLKLVEGAGVLCPVTTINREDMRIESQWLFKPMFSLGGRHIQLANDYPPPIVEGYFQEFIPGEDRRYELRVHACNWRDPTEFLCQKRVHDDLTQITWNHHTGGRFITVNRPLNWRIFREAQQLSKRALDAVGLDFGGVDFIVTKDGDILFLEINTSLGFTLEASRIFWVDSMNLLTEGESNEL